MNRIDRICNVKIQKVIAGIAAAAMLVSLSACARKHESTSTPFAPQDETNMDTERIPYAINNDYILDMDGMDALLQPEDYTFVPRESDLEILQSLKEQYPENAEKIQFFISVPITRLRSIMFASRRKRSTLCWRSDLPHRRKQGIGTSPWRGSPFRIISSMTTAGRSIPTETGSWDTPAAALRALPWYLRQ